MTLDREVSQVVWFLQRCAPALQVDGKIIVARSDRGGSAGSGWGTTESLFLSRGRGKIGAASRDHQRGCPAGLLDAELSND